MVGRVRVSESGTTIIDSIATSLLIFLIVHCSCEFSDGCEFGCVLRTKLCNQLSLDESVQFASAR